MMMTMKLSAFYLIIVNCTLVVPVPEVGSGNCTLVVPVPEVGSGTMVIGIDIV